MQWFIFALRRYIEFKGRSRRRELWMYLLFISLLGVGALFLDSLFGFVSVGRIDGPIFLLFNAIVLLPTLAVSIRRLHDIDKSGWWFLVILIPVIGLIWLFIYFLREGSYGSNRFGPDPKETLN